MNMEVENYAHPFLSVFKDICTFLVACRATSLVLSRFSPLIMGISGYKTQRIITVPNEVMFLMF